MSEDKKLDANDQKLLEALAGIDIAKRYPLFNQHRIKANHSEMADFILKVLSIYGFELCDMEIAFTIVRYKLSGVLEINNGHGNEPDWLSNNP